MEYKPDEYYIKQTLKGNVNAYSFLVEKYKHMLYTLIIRMVKNKEEAEEISQDVFVKAYTNLSSFKGDSKFSTWLYKIGYYACLDVIKKNKRTISSENIDEIKDVNTSEIKDVLTNLENEDRKKVINDAILRLNNDEQVILTLFYFDEMSIKEISKVVNLSLDNVKVKLHRSRKKLFSLLSTVIEPKTMNLL